ncbi:MAG: hypothetical protein KDD62_06345, partial [Bdellovibrionales bacterium]|nr:hypothetical protein [Bdellovibrionales bacterium]
MVTPSQSSAQSSSNRDIQLSLFNDEMLDEVSPQNELLAKVRKIVESAYTGKSGWGVLDPQEVESGPSLKGEYFDGGQRLFWSLEEEPNLTTQPTEETKVELTTEHDPLDAVQKLFWAISQPQLEEMPSQVAAPINKQTKRRNAGRGEKLTQARLAFGEPVEGELIEGPEPELRDKFIRKVTEFPTKVTLGSGTEIAVLESIEALVAHYKIQHVVPNLLHSKHEQLRCFMVAQEIDENQFLEA